MGRLLLILCSFAPGFPARLRAADPAPVITDSPLTADQEAVAHAFLNSYFQGSKASHNLANITMPLALSDAEKKGCFSGMDIETPATQPALLHHLTDETFRASEVNLVGGPSLTNGHIAAYGGGMLRISEVAFDSAHRFAIMSYSYRCGHLCGNGATRVFQKKHGEWKPANRNCGGGWFN